MKILLQNKFGFYLLILLLVMCVPLFSEAKSKDLKSKLEKVTVIFPNGGEHFDGNVTSPVMPINVQVSNLKAKGSLTVYLTSKNGKNWLKGNYYLLSESKGIVSKDYLSQRIYSLAMPGQGPIYKSGNYYVYTEWKGDDGKILGDFSDKPFFIDSTQNFPIANLASSTVILSELSGKDYKFGEELVVRWQTLGIKVNPDTAISFMDNRIDYQLDSFGLAPALTFAKLIKSNEKTREYEYELKIKLRNNYNDFLPEKYKNILGGKHYKIVIVIVPEAQQKGLISKTTQDLFSIEKN